METLRLQVQDIYLPTIQHSQILGVDLENFATTNSMLSITLLLMKEVKIMLDIHAWVKSYIEYEW